MTHGRSQGQLAPASLLQCEWWYHPSCPLWKRERKEALIDLMKHKTTSSPWDRQLFFFFNSFFFLVHDEGHINKKVQDFFFFFFFLLLLLLLFRFRPKKLQYSVVDYMSSYLFDNKRRTSEKGFRCIWALKSLSLKLLASVSFPSNIYPYPIVFRSVYARRDDDSGARENRNNSAHGNCITVTVAWFRIERGEAIKLPPLLACSWNSV